MSSLSVPPRDDHPVTRRGAVIVGATLAAGGIAAASVAFAEQPASSGTTSSRSCCPIVELRQYTLRPGRRDAFIALFEEQFVDSQEALDMNLIGTFRDLDDPDRFVWMRGFEDMDRRRTALTAFYGSPLWKAHRADANASINDSDNVLLLRRLNEGSGFPSSRLRRPPRGTSKASRAIILASLNYVDSDKAGLFAEFFEANIRPRLEALDIPVVARFVTETSPNTFPGLPVRDMAHVFAWFSVCADERDCDARISRLRRSQTWRNGASDPILRQLARKPEILRLAPTGRSALRA